jgi:PAS domain S-box-containing protein
MPTLSPTLSPRLGATLSRPSPETDARAVIATDASGVIRHVTCAAQQLLGYDARDLLGRSLKTVHVAAELESRTAQIGGRGTDELEAVFAGVRGGRVPHERQRWTMVCADSTLVRVDTTVTAVYGVDEVVAFVVLLDSPQPVAGQAEWPAQLARYGDDYAASVSHEVRTPAAIILGYLELLQSQDAGPLTDAQRTMLEKVELNTNRMLEMMQSMLRQYPVAVEAP